MNELKPIEPEYIYVTIPAEYICVYHRILAMMADYGEEMLKDCKASCTNRNTGVIECFNMFNSAVAARKLGNTKLAELIIKYIKLKINQIYKGKDNSTSFVFPIDENGQLKAFVSCGERPRFEINADDGALYEHKFENGFTEHFKLGLEDLSQNESEIQPKLLNVVITPFWEKINNEVRPCANIKVTYNGDIVNLTDTSYQYYFDDRLVSNFNNVANISTGEHNFKVVVIYKEETCIASATKYFGTTVDNDNSDNDSDNDNNDNGNTSLRKSKNINLQSLSISKKAFPIKTAIKDKYYYNSQVKFRLPITLTKKEFIKEINNVLESLGYSDIDSVKSYTLQYRNTDDGPKYVGNILTIDSLYDSYSNADYSGKDKHKGAIILINLGKYYYFKRSNEGISVCDSADYGYFVSKPLPDFISTQQVCYKNFHKEFVIYKYRKIISEHIGRPYFKKGELYWNNNSNFIKIKYWKPIDKTIKTKLLDKSETYLYKTLPIIKLRRRKDKESSIKVYIYDTARQGYMCINK